MKLSVIIPVYNEARHLETFLERFFATPCPLERECIIVDDCSSDGSRALLKKLQSKYGYRFLPQEKNQGKGAAIRSAIPLTTGDVVLIQDADFEYDPNDIPGLLEPLIEKRADVVFGSRFRKNAPQAHRTYHYLVNRILTMLSNLFSGLYLTDMETCYKIFRSDLLKSMNLRSRRFGIEVELTAYIAKTRARVFELPIHYYPRTYLQGKKITWKDGIAALRHLFYYNWIVSREAAFEGLPKQYAP